MNQFDDFHCYRNQTEQNHAERGHRGPSFYTVPTAEEAASMKAFVRETCDRLNECANKGKPIMDFTRIRHDIRSALDRYAKDGCPVGDFLQAVLANDLMDALGRADDYNRETIWDICGYVYNEMPSGCHGSRAAYRDWIANKAIQREHAGIASDIAELA
jgi:hypothetical protein